MPDPSFYTQDQYNRMNQFEDLRADNYERDPNQHYLANADSQTQQMYADARSSESYFQVTGRKLDETGQAFAQLQERRQQGHRVRTSDYERAERRYAIAYSSHSESIEPYLQNGLNYERRMEGILDRAGVPRPGSMAQMAMATQPAQSHGSSHGGSHQSTTGHGHHSSHRSSHHSSHRSSRR
ncbi:hypothetical protein ACWGJ2_13640 [Streptomyces sp. NPDC054796]